jgi:transposase
MRRIIGIDLAVESTHKAIVIDESGKFITRVIEFETDVRALAQMLGTARQEDPECEVWVVMEPTGMAWFPIAAYFARQDNTHLYLVNAQQVADLRRFYKRHAKSDRIDVRLLARLPLINGDQLHELVLSSATALACQRGCKQLDRVEEEITALKNRILAADRFAWPGLEMSVFAARDSLAVRWFRCHWYNPACVIAAGAEEIQRQWQAAQLDPGDPGNWSQTLVELAQRVLLLYGEEAQFLDYDLLQAEILNDQEQLLRLEELSHQLRLKTVRPLYRRLHPSRNLETLRGVGQDSAAVFVSTIGDPQRFASNRLFRGWHGLVPDSRQSGDSEATGLQISKAGPDLIKKYAYLDAQVARQWDPQLAAIYYDQMVQKGKHHVQAVCACATHLLDRILVVLREDKPYELRDVDGTPVSLDRGREIVLERYQVPKEVRRRSSKRHRKERQDQQAEKKQQGKAAQT